MISLRKLLFALCVVAIATQTGFSQGFSFGPKAGINISNFTGGNNSTSAIVNPHFGGFLNFGIAKVVSIQPEVLFSAQGGKISTGSSKEEFKLTYIAVPVMLKIHLGPGLYIEGGPQFAFKTGEDVGNSSINSFAKDLDLSLGAGLGYKLPIGLGFGARYVSGLSKVGDFNGINNIDPDFKNSIIQISAFWQIGSHK